MKARICSSDPRFRMRSGVATVEFAVVAPVVAILLVGLLSVGRLVQVNQIVTNAAREGARKASTGVNTYADVQTAVANYLTNAGIKNQSGLTVTVYNVTQGNSGPTFDPSTAVCLDQLNVTVSLPFSNVQLAPLPNLGFNVVTATAVWFSNQDQAYPSTVTPPSGS